MSKSSDNPYFTAELTPPLNDTWAARRKAAASLRHLSEALLTRTVDAEVMNDIVAALDQQVAVLERGAQTLGRSRYASSEEHGNIAQVDYELGPVNGQANAVAPPLRVWIEGDRVYGSVTMGWQYEGPPASVHGGFVAALFDQLLGVGQLLAEKPGFTGTLSIRYLRPTPLNTELRLEGWVDRVEGRKNYLVGEMWAGETLTATSEGLFISVDPADLGATTLP